jgi:hypothetical protein
LALRVLFSFGRRLSLRDHDRAIVLAGGNPRRVSERQ